MKIKEMPIKTDGFGMLQCKKELIKTLKEMGIIKEIFTGQIILNINQSGITDIKRTETLR